MKLSISEAARRAGVKRTTIYRKLDAGKLSKETDEDGNPVIQLAELARVYPHAVTDPGRKPETPRTPERDNETAETAALRELVAVLKQDKERLTMELERARIDARTDVERERSERERLLGMLETAQHQLTDLRERPKEEPAPPRRSWFARLVRA